MKPRDLDVDELCRFTENIRNLLSEGALAGLPDEARADLLLRFSNDHSSLEHHAGELKFLRGQIEAETVRWAESRTNAIDAAAVMQTWLNAVKADAADFELFGFDPPPV